VGPEVDPVEAELGEGAIAKLAAGEARGGGRRGGFLSTSGSFTLSSGADSNTAGNEELGEGDSDLNRQCNPLGTTEVAKIMALAASHGLGESKGSSRLEQLRDLLATILVPSCATPRAGPQPQNTGTGDEKTAEALRAEIAALKAQMEEMKRGDSSSAAKNAAACSGENQGGPTEGSLDCSGYRGEPEKKDIMRQAGSECPDNLSTGSFWIVNMRAGTGCQLFTSVRTLIGKTYVSGHKSGRLAGVITKGKTHHPHRTSKKTGVLALKRLKCNRNKCVVFKTVVCAKCHKNTFQFTQSDKATQDELEAWAKCIQKNAWDNVGKSDAELKEEYRCDPKDQAIANDWAKAF
jgi:hypothetical protein